MLLVDTSAWITYFRGGDGASPAQMRQLVGERWQELATTEPVAMEVLAGARDDTALGQLEALTNGLALLPVNAHRDFHDAAGLFRAARRRGKTVRKLVDCLIAAVAIRHQATLVHRDADFDVIAEVAPLVTYRIDNHASG